MSVFFFFNDTAPPEIYPLSLHDALPICPGAGAFAGQLGRDEQVHFVPQPPLEEAAVDARAALDHHRGEPQDRKSTRLNSSHSQISYAVFCLKKKKTSWHSIVHTRARRHA